MNKVRLTMREVNIVDTVDTGYTWEEANNRSTVIGWKIWLWWLPFVLLFRKWESVLAPKGTPCALTTMGGNPLYQYKKLGKKVYYLGPEPSPGFPGS